MRKWDKHIVPLCTRTHTRTQTQKPTSTQSKSAVAEHEHRNGAEFGQSENAIAMFACGFWNSTQNVVLTVSLKSNALHFTQSTNERPKQMYMRANSNMVALLFALMPSNFLFDSHRIARTVYSTYFVLFLW